MQSCPARQFGMLHHYERANCMVRDFGGEFQRLDSVLAGPDHGVATIRFALESYDLVSSTRGVH